MIIWQCPNISDDKLRLNSSYFWVNMVIQRMLMIITKKMVATADKTWPNVDSHNVSTFHEKYAFFTVFMYLNAMLAKVLCNDGTLNWTKIHRSKFSKSQTGSHVTYSCQHNLSLFLSPYLSICGISLSSIHYNQSQRIYINRKQKYIYIISN